MTTHGTSSHHSLSPSRGSIFIRSDAPLPPWFRFNYEEYEGWKHLFDTNSLVLERTAITTGWYFSFVVSEIACTGWGMSAESALYRALEEVLERMNNYRFNSFEIADVTDYTFLLLHVVQITAAPRHLGPSPFLRSLDPHSSSHVVEEVEEIFWRAADVQPESKGL